MIYLLGILPLREHPVGIFKFTNNGSFITRWGEYGTEEGQVWWFSHWYYC